MDLDARETKLSASLASGLATSGRAGANRRTPPLSRIDIYFWCLHAPWQRGTSENTNGLLRQYFPKGTDLSIHSAIDLDWVATELNDRPRKRLAFAKPIEEIGPLLLQ